MTADAAEIPNDNPHVNDDDEDDESSVQDENDDDESGPNLSKFKVKIELGGNLVKPTFEDVSDDVTSATEKGKQLEQLQQFTWDPRINIFGK